MNRTKKFLCDGLILAASAVFMRTVGVSWNAYVSNMVGAESMGLLSLSMSVYGFAVTLACFGVGFGVTRTISEALGRGENNKAIESLKAAVCYSLVFGIFTCLFLLKSAEFIGTKLLSDIRTVASIRIMAISMLPISLSSVFNGYFNAVRRVYKSAFCGMIEQFFRMAACVALFSVLLPKGVEGGCIAIVGGGCVAECLSAIWGGFMCLIDKKRNLKQNKTPSKTPIMELERTLAKISVPIAASACIRSALLTLEHMLIPKTLKMNGLSHSAALSTYGLLGSMVLPIVLYPASLTSSFASLLVPELSESKARNDYEHIKRASLKAIMVTFAFSACVSGIMLSYSGQLGRIIYNSNEAGKYIRLLAPIIPIMYLDTVVDSMLKGLGYQVYTMIVNIVDAALSVIGVLILIPKFGILGYVILISVSELINASASIWKLVNVVKIEFSIRKVAVIPTLLSISSCYVIKVLYSRVIYLSPESVFGLVLHIVSVVLVYGCFCGTVHLFPKIKNLVKIKKPFAV